MATSNKTTKTTKKVPAKKAPAKKVVAKKAPAKKAPTKRVTAKIPLGKVTMIPMTDTFPILRKLIHRMAAEYCKYNKTSIKVHMPLSLVVCPQNMMLSSGVACEMGTGPGKNECLIMIDPKRHDEGMVDEIICHELIHYLQFVTKRFKNKGVDQSDINSLDPGSYRFDPAEVEAWGLMSYFARKYLWEGSPDFLGTKPQKKVKK